MRLRKNLVVKCIKSSLFDSIMTSLQSCKKAKWNSKANQIKKRKNISAAITIVIMRKFRAFKIFLWFRHYSNSIDFDVKLPFYSFNFGLLKRILIFFCLRNYFLALSFFSLLSVTDNTPMAVCRGKWVFGSQKLIKFSLFTLFDEKKAMASTVAAAEKRNIILPVCRKFIKMN